jgi:hypothetical protein
MKRFEPTCRAPLIFAVVAAVAAAAWAQTCGAQVRLPGVSLPSLPLGGVTQTPGLVANGLIDDLTQLRALRVRALVQANRREIDTDRNGAPVLRGIAVAVAPGDAALVQARAAGFGVISDQSYAALTLRVVTLRAPAHWSTREALDRLRKLDPAGTYEYDHLYDAGGAVSPRDTRLGPPASAQASSTAAATPPAATTPATPAPASPPRVGLIDTGIDAAHAVFRDARIHIWGCDGRPVSSDHGTAVASLLVGDAPPFAGVLPHGEVYAADVYCGRPTGGAADTIVAAMSWLASQQVGVINISLVGPRDLLLGRAVELAQKRGHIIVAAVGNDGPSAPPLYPAAYPGVVGVTAVDARHKVLLEACRGPHVSFAAPGADMEGAGVSGSYHALRGTSFAAPIVAALLAMTFPAPDPAAAPAHIDALAREAIDLGSPGRDAIYGYGLVGAQYRVPPAPGVH